MLLLGEKLANCETTAAFNLNTLSRKLRVVLIRLKKTLAFSLSVTSCCILL